MLRRHETAGATTLARVGPTKNARPVQPEPIGDDSDAAAARDDGGSGISHAETMRLSQCPVNALFAPSLRSSQWQDSAPASHNQRMTGEELGRLLEMPGRSQASLARWLGFTDNSYVNKIVKGTRKIKLEEAPKIAEYLRVTAHGDEVDPGIDRTPDQPTRDPEQSYVTVEVLPTFAGMGGGGTGDADRETALVSRRLVEDELRARPTDLLLINVRGNSMEPLFHHGDQLIIDRRDTSPTQPGPFALLYDDGYVVKNVAWVDKRTKLRVSSSNPEFGPEDFDPNEVTIMGRPVWFARRL